MDSAIFIFILTITIVDCNGIKPSDLRKLLQRRALNFYAAKGWPTSVNQPPYRNHETGASVPDVTNYFGRTYGQSDGSDKRDAYQGLRRGNKQQVVNLPTVVIALLRSKKQDTTEKDSNKLVQNDWMLPDSEMRRMNPRFNFSEQKRAINLLELPIAHYVKDYHKIELEIQKREAEMRQKQQNRQRAEIPATKTDPPFEYFSKNYNRFKEEMMQNQNRFQVLQEDSRSLKKKDNLLPEYDSKQKRLYYNYDDRASSRERPESQRPDREPSNLQSQERPIPRPQIQDPMILRPRDVLASRSPGSDPQSRDTQIPDPIQNLMYPKLQSSDSQPLDNPVLHQLTINQQVSEIKDDPYIGLPKWQPEPSPLPVPQLNELASLGIKPGEENYNWQAVLDQSSINLADMSIEHLVSEYRKLEEEIKRRKKLVEKYKNSIRQAQMLAHSEQMEKPDLSQNYNFYPSSLPRPPSLPVHQLPRGPFGSNSQGQLNPERPPDSPEPSFPIDLEQPDRYPVSPTMRPADQGSFKERATRSVPIMMNKNIQRNIPLGRMGKIHQDFKEDLKPTFDQPYMSDSELAKLIYSRPVEENNERNRLDEEMVNNETFNFGPEPVTGIIRYPNRKSNSANIFGANRPTGLRHQETKFNFDPVFNRLYIVYVQRIWNLNNRKRHKLIASSPYQYAYVDLERLEDLIKRYRRQQDIPDDSQRINMKLPFDEEPSISMESELEAATEPSPVGKTNWFINSGDAYNHIKIDPDAPDMSDFMPNSAFKVNGTKYWFYHQNDFIPFTSR